MHTTPVVAPDSQHDERSEGFGMVEIIISMFLLALLCLSFLPLLIASLKATVSNTTLATATQLLGEQLELSTTAAGSTPTCQTIKAFANSTTVGTLTDPRGVVLQAHRQLVIDLARTDSTGCPLSYPGTVRYHAWVTVSGDSSIVVDATTLVYVQKAVP